MPSAREKQIYKIIMITSGIIALGVAAYLLVAMFSGAKNYFTNHFAIPIVLVCVGIIALCMPLATRSRFGSDAKDNVMKIVAILLILFAILTLVLSYFDIFQF